MAELESEDIEMLKGKNSLFLLFSYFVVVGYMLQLQRFYSEMVSTKKEHFLQMREVEPALVI